MAEARSSFPSPSKSATVTQRGSLVVVKSSFGAKEVSLITPLVAVFRRREMESLPWLTQMMSSRPSPSKSASRTRTGVAPTAKSTRPAKVELSTTPPVPVLRYTEMLPLE